MEKVLNRKEELLRRDPLYDKFCKATHDVIVSGVAVPLDDRAHAMMVTLDNSQAWALAGPMITLQNEINEKWNIRISMDCRTEQVSIFPDISDSAIWVGTPRSGTHAFQWSQEESKFDWSPCRDPFEKPDILTSPLPGLAGKWLPILVNVSRLNKADAKTVKKQLWSLIEANLQKNATRSPKWESKECTFLYSIRREETFQNYLRWYDLAIGTNYQKPNGFSFRAIAFCEYVLRNHPERYEDAKVEIAKRSKVVRTARGERKLEGVVGDHIKGEDRVEKGVKVIYSAIHRKPYPSKKTEQKEYNCPTHGKSCPTLQCPYAKNFVKDFNKRNMLFKPLYTTDPADLPQVIGEGRSHSKRKPTADQQSNTK